MKIEKYFSPTILLLLLVTLVMHGFLFIGNSAMWDSLLLVNAKNYGSNIAMKNCIYNTGRRIEYFIALAFFKMPNYLAVFKIVSFLLIALSNIITYKILDYFLNKQTVLNFFITTLITAIPIYTLWFEPILFSFTVCQACFSVAFLLYLKSQSMSTILRYTSFIGIGFLFFWSFELQSFYVFIYPLLLALFIKQYQIQNTLWQNILNFLSRHFIILLFPVFSFWLWNKLFPISDMAKFSGYNKISFSILSFVYHFGFSFFKMFVMLPYLLLQLIIHNPINAVVSAIISFTAGWYIFTKIKLPQRPQIKLWVILLLGAVLFIAALFPYNIVGKDYGALNRNCRNGLLAGYGLIFTLLLLANYYIKNDRHLKKVYLSLFVLFAVGSNMSYLFWQAYYVRFQKAEQLFAVNNKNFKSDYLIVKEEVNNPMHQYFTYYEFNFMCKEAIGGKEKYLAIDEHSGWDKNIDTFLLKTKTYRSIFMFSNFNNKVDLPQHISLVSPANALFDCEKTVWQYWMNGFNAKDYPMIMKIE